MKKILFTGLLVISTMACAAEKPLMTCGPFLISSSDDGFAHINHMRPQSQKITFLKADGDYRNIKYQWMLPDPQVGHWLGLDYIKRNGKAMLNVEVIRTNMDAPRQYWTYDCRRVG